MNDLIVCNFPKLSDKVMDVIKSDYPKVCFDYDMFRLDLNPSCRISMSIAYMDKLVMLLGKNKENTEPEITIEDRIKKLEATVYAK